jgi:hypothetical protein
MRHVRHDDLIDIYLGWERIEMTGQLDEKGRMSQLDGSHKLAQLSLDSIQTILKLSVVNLHFVSIYGAYLKVP